MDTITLTDAAWTVVENALALAAATVTDDITRIDLEAINIQIQEQHYADILCATAAVEAEMEAELIEQTRPENTGVSGVVTVSLSLIAWLLPGHTKDDVLADVVSNLGSDYDSASATKVGGTAKLVRVAVKFPAPSEDEGRRMVRHLGGRLRYAHDSVVVSVHKRKASR